MEKLSDLDFNQNDSSIDDLNLNAVWVDLDKGEMFVSLIYHSFNKIIN